LHEIGIMTHPLNFYSESDTDHAIKLRNFFLLGGAYKEYISKVFISGEYIDPFSFYQFIPETNDGQICIDGVL
jgi:hypothetical protein